MVPKGGTPPATFYLGLWTGATATTVPDKSCVLSTYTGVAEANYPGYSRQPIAASQWGATADTTVWAQTGRGTTGPQVSLPPATDVYNTQINGFFIATDSVHGSEIGLWYSNFAGGNGLASLAIGDAVRVTPTWAYLP